MQYLKKISAIVVSSFLFFACSENNSSSKANDSASAKATSSETSSAGDASFSCKIDGKDFSGKGTDQIVNAASVHAPGIIYFSLSPDFSGDVSADMRARWFWL